MSAARDLGFVPDEVEQEYCTQLARRRQTYLCYDVFRVLAGLLAAVRAPALEARVASLAVTLGSAADLEVHLGQRGCWRQRGVLTICINVANMLYTSRYHSVLFPEPAAAGALRSALQTLFGCGGVLLHFAAQATCVPWTWQVAQQAVICAMWLVNAPCICTASPSMRATYAGLHAAIKAMLRPATAAVWRLTGLGTASEGKFLRKAEWSELQVCAAYERTATVLLGFLLSCAVAHWMECNAREAFLRHQPQAAAAEHAAAAAEAWNAPLKCGRSWAACALDAAPLVLLPLHCFMAYLAFL